MIRVFIADDHQMIRDGLRHVLEKNREIVLVGEAADAFDLIEQLKSVEFDVLVLDIKMPGSDGISLLKQLISGTPDIKVIIFTMYNEDSFAVRFYRAGAKGYVGKNRPPNVLIEAIKKVHQGGKYVSEELSDLIFENEISLTKQPHENLSDREMEVLLQLAAGLRPSDISNKMGRSIGTVTTYISRIKQKLAVDSIGEIIHYAYKYHLVD